MLKMINLDKIIKINDCDIGMIYNDTIKSLISTGSNIDDENIDDDTGYPYPTILITLTKCKLSTFESKEDFVRELYNRLLPNVKKCDLLEVFYFCNYHKLNIAVTTNRGVGNIFILSSETFDLIKRNSKKYANALKKEYTIILEDYIPYGNIIIGYNPYDEDELSPKFIYSLHRAIHTWNKNGKKYFGLIDDKIQNSFRMINISNI